MLALTFSTGVVDAVGYLGLDRVFTGNMTGNVVIIGMAAARGDELPLLGPVLALIGFLVGAAGAGRALRQSQGWTPTTSLVLLTVGVVLGGVAGASAAIPAISVPPGAEPSPQALTVTTVLGLAMGAQAAAARRVGVKDVTTVVVTSTLTALAADSHLAGGPGKNWPRQLIAVALMILGALTGALLLRWHIAAGLGVAAATVLVVTGLGHRQARTETTVVDADAVGAR